MSWKDSLLEFKPFEARNKKRNSIRRKLDSGLKKIAVGVSFEEISSIKDLIVYFQHNLRPGTVLNVVCTDPMFAVDLLSDCLSLNPKLIQNLRDAKEWDDTEQNFSPIPNERPVTRTDDAESLRTALTDLGKDKSDPNKVKIIGTTLIAPRSNGAINTQMEPFSSNNLRSYKGEKLSLNPLILVTPEPISSQNIQESFGGNVRPILDINRLDLFPILRGWSRDAFQSVFTGDPSRSSLKGGVVSTRPGEDFESKLVRVLGLTDVGESYSKLDDYMDLIARAFKPCFDNKPHIVNQLTEVWIKSVNDSRDRIDLDVALSAAKFKAEKDIEVSSKNSDSQSILVRLNYRDPKIVTVTGGLLKLKNIFGSEKVKQDDEDIPEESVLGILGSQSGIQDREEEEISKKVGGFYLLNGPSGTDVDRAVDFVWSLLGEHTYSGWKLDSDAISGGIWGQSERNSRVALNQLSLLENAIVEVTNSPNTTDEAIASENNGVAPTQMSLQRSFISFIDRGKDRLRDNNIIIFVRNNGRLNKDLLPKKDDEITFSFSGPEQLAAKLKDIAALDAGEGKSRVSHLGSNLLSSYISDEEIAWDIVEMESEVNRERGDTNSSVLTSEDLPNLWRTIKSKLKDNYASIKSDIANQTSEDKKDAVRKMRIATIVYESLRSSGLLSSVLDVDTVRRMMSGRESFMLNMKERRRKAGISEKGTGYLYPGVTLENLSSHREKGDNERGFPLPITNEEKVDFFKRYINPVDPNKHSLGQYLGEEPEELKDVDKLHLTPEEIAEKEERYRIFREKEKEKERERKHLTEKYHTQIDKKEPPFSRNFHDKLNTGDPITSEDSIKTKNAKFEWKKSGKTPFSWEGMYD